MPELENGLTGRYGYTTEQQREDLEMGYRKIDWNSPFTRALYEYRIKNELNQEELARIMGVSRLSVMNWESGRNKPRLAYIYLAFERLHIPFETLVTKGWAERKPLEPSEPSDIGARIQLAGASMNKDVRQAVIDVLETVVANLKLELELEGAGES